MQIIDTKIKSNKKYNSPSFQASLARNKAAEVVIDGTLKIASAAVAAIGTAAIAISQKEESIEEIQFPTSKDANYPELEIIEPLSMEDAKKIYKKLKINKEAIANFDLYSEDSRKFLSIIINYYTNFDTDSTTTLEEGISSVLKESLEDEKPETFQAEIKNHLKNLKYITKNNIAVLMQNCETNIKAEDLIDDEGFSKNITSFYQFLLDFKDVTNKKFKLDKSFRFKDTIFPAKEDIEKIYKLLQKNPEKDYHEQIYFEKIEDLKKHNVLEKISLERDYPDIPKNIMYEIAKTELDIESSRIILETIAKKIETDPRFKDYYYAVDIQKVCKKWWFSKST